MEENGHGGISWRNIASIVLGLLVVVIGLVVALAQYSIVRIEKDIDKLDNRIGGNYNELRDLEREVYQLKLYVGKINKQDSDYDDPEAKGSRWPGKWH